MSKGGREGGREGGKERRKDKDKTSYIIRTDEKKKKKKKHCPSKEGEPPTQREES